MKKLLASLMAVIVVFSLAACGGNNPAPTTSANTGTAASQNATSQAPASQTSTGPVELKFMFWGSLVEKAEVEKCVENYNKLNEGKIHVTAQHVPDDYANKLATMVAGGTAPDIAYVSSGLAPTYAKEGKLLFVEDILGNDKSFLDTVLPGAQWKVDGKVAFFSTAMETLMITYNKDIFDQHGVKYPPSKFEEALNWEQFVDLCQQVTIDANGKNAKDPAFDANNIVTYGLSMSTYLNHILMLLASNGGSVLNADSSNTAFDSPEWIDTMNKINDLIYKYHVVPSPATSESLAAEAMLTGQIAMTCDGNWSLLDYQDQGLNVGVAVFPDLGKGPYSMSAPGVTAIFNSTQHPQEAWDFYKYSLDAENGPTDLFKKGLWQPVYSVYYTDPAKIAFWVDTPAHPAEYRDVVIANIDRNIVPLPTQYILKWGDVSAILNPAIDTIFRNPGDATQALKDAQATVNSSGAYHGRYDQ